MKQNENITIHMVMSLDGYIAKKEDDYEWLHSTDHYEAGITLSDQQIENYLSTIDCYFMGSKTYENALKLGWPYGDKPVYVFTNRIFKFELSNVKFVQGEIAEIIQTQLKPLYNNIWMVGGAMLTKYLLNDDLADQLIVTIAPIILGDGIPFFDHIAKENRLRLLSSTAYKNGMVELTYAIKQTT